MFVRFCPGPSCCRPVLQTLPHSLLHRTSSPHLCCRVWTRNLRASVTVTRLPLCLPQHKQSQNSMQKCNFFLENNIRGPLRPETFLGADEGPVCNPLLAAFLLTSHLAHQPTAVQKNGKQSVPALVNSYFIWMFSGPRCSRYARERRSHFAVECRAV